MKITGVKVKRRGGEARAPAGLRSGNDCVIELCTDGGLTGIGIADARAGKEVRRLVNGVLVDADPRSVTGLWQQMETAHSAARRRSPVRNAIAALDVALWDLKAKANDEPLWKTLGGARPKANAYASNIDSTLCDEELSLWFQRMADEYGLRGGKLRVGTDEGGNSRRLGRMRAALERTALEPSLMIDAGRCWPAGKEIDMVRALEEQFDLTWIEGLSGDRDVRGLKRISDSVSGALCVGAGFATIGDFWPHFHHRTADVIRIDIAAIGITGALQIADAAFGLELPVTLSAVPGNIHAHLAGVMPAFMSVEVVDPEPTAKTFSSDVRIEGGWAVAGDASGNGLILRASLEPT